MDRWGHPDKLLEKISERGCIHTIMVRQSLVSQLDYLMTEGFGDFGQTLKFRFFPPPSAFRSKTPGKRRHKSQYRRNKLGIRLNELRARLLSSHAPLPVAPLPLMSNAHPGEKKWSRWCGWTKVGDMRGKIPPWICWSNQDKIGRKCRNDEDSQEVIYILPFWSKTNLRRCYQSR